MYEVTADTHAHAVVAASLRKPDQVLCFVRGMWVGRAGRQGPREDLSDREGGCLQGRDHYGWADRLHKGALKGH